MIKDCPQPESPWKPIVIGAPFWSKKYAYRAPIQLELFPLQLELFRACIPRGNDAEVTVPPAVLRESLTYAHVEQALSVS